jgi:hypothetical protein
MLRDKAITNPTMPPTALPAAYALLCDEEIAAGSIARLLSAQSAARVPKVIDKIFVRRLAPAISARCLFVKCEYATRPSVKS